MLRYRGDLKNDCMITRENEKWFRIAGLLARQRVGQLSEEELRELEEWKEPMFADSGSRGNGARSRKPRAPCADRRR